MFSSVQKDLKPEFIVDFETKFLHNMLIPNHEKKQEKSILRAYLKRDESNIERERRSWQEKIQGTKRNEELINIIKIRVEKEVTEGFHELLDALEFGETEIPMTRNEIRLFEALAKSETDTHFIGRCIQDIIWLQNELTSVFNKNNMLRQSEATVKDPKLIISYMGVENARLWIGYLCNRHWLPMRSFRIQDAVMRTHSYQTTHALTVRQLSRALGMDHQHLYLATILRNCAASSILKFSADIAKIFWSKWLRDAQQNGEDELYNAILQTRFPIHKIADIWYERYNGANNAIFNQISWKESKSLKIVQELNSGKALENLSQQAKVIKKCACYTKIIMMRQWRVRIPRDQINKIFGYYQISENEQRILTETNFKKLPLV